MLWVVMVISSCYGVVLPPTDLLAIAGDGQVYFEWTVADEAYTTQFYVISLCVVIILDPGVNNFTLSDVDNGSEVSVELTHNDGGTDSVGVEFSVVTPDECEKLGTCGPGCSACLGGCRATCCYGLSEGPCTARSNCTWCPSSAGASWDASCVADEQCPPMDIHVRDPCWDAANLSTNGFTPLFTWPTTELPLDYEGDGWWRVSYPRGCLNFTVEVPGCNSATGSACDTAWFESNASVAPPACTYSQEECSAVSYCTWCSTYGCRNDTACELCPAYNEVVCGEAVNCYWCPHSTACIDSPACPPAGLTTEDASSPSILKLVWSGDMSGHTRFHVERADDASFSVNRVVASVTDFPEAYAVGLVPGQTYHYRVASVSSGVWSEWITISAATTVPCGDGTVDPTEQCDDNNLIDGDGCSSTCEVEPGYVCNVTCSQPSCPGDIVVDCSGECGGFAVFDECGDCAGGSTGYTYNSAKDFCGACGGANETLDDCGVCAHLGRGYTKDACQVCHGDNSTCAGCDGIPNSGRMLDACGVCGGDNSTCLGCNGLPVPAGGVLFDQCGICGGNSTTCLMGCDGNVSSGLYFDCAGTCNGSAVIDDCGVCAGGEANGTFNGNMDSCGRCFGSVDVLDVCGSCYSVEECLVEGYTGTCSGGTCTCPPGIGSLCDICISGGTTCTGCDGANATYDLCGVCGGNGTSCLGCDGVSMFEGGKTYDACGECGGDATSCIVGCDGSSDASKHVDCFGVCEGTATVDACGMCVGGTTGFLPLMHQDDCDDCFGGNRAKDSCGDCDGGNAARDVCGVCDGGNKDRDICGRCYGYNQTVNACGKCNATTMPCLGCDGVPNSLRMVDSCGVCGGDGVCSENISTLPPEESIALGLIVGLAVLFLALICCVVAVVLLKRGRSNKIAAYKDGLAEEAPVGKVFMVFTDIQNSTMLWECYPDHMPLALELHNHKARVLLEELGGYEVKTEGDAFMITFAHGGKALRWCAAMQLALLDAKWPAEVLRDPNCCQETSKSGKLLWSGVRVRMGVYVGYPNEQFDERSEKVDYYGPDVNRAARVAGTGSGGQIVVSRETLDDPQVQEELSTGRYIQNSLGTHLLKGLQEGIEIVQVLPKELKSRRFPPLKIKKAGDVEKADEEEDSNRFAGLARMQPMPAMDSNRSSRGRRTNRTNRESRRRRGSGNSSVSSLWRNRRLSTSSRGSRSGNYMELNSVAVVDEPIEES